jgi:ATP-dependent RNA helicase RhlE
LTSFSDLKLDPRLLSALAAKNHLTPTPIQAQAIPYVLEGRDVLGIAQTGTGKTGAFALPILQRLAAANQRPQPRTCRALILSPTRELASQIAESFQTYGANLGLSTLVVFGGVSDRPQADRLARGVDILVATPGRLIDHLDQRNLRLDDVSIFVLDEADQMLDMGFIHALRRLVPKLPKVRQNLFFSATMPREIGSLAGELLRDPAKVSVTPVASTVERIDQRVIFVETARKRTILSEILRGDAMGRTLVFTRTKHGADKVVRSLEVDGITSAAIHGNKSQNQRERALAGFKSGATKVLVATDIAARGIDINGVTHVINYDLPNVPESYVHRIGRTARAGADGSAISFCDGEERPFLRAIESLIRLKLPATDKRQPGAPASPEPPPAANGRPHRPQNGRPPMRGARPGGGGDGATRRPGGQPDRNNNRRRNRPKLEDARAPTPR